MLLKNRRHLPFRLISTTHALAVLALLAPAAGLAQYSTPMRDVENPAHSPLRFSKEIDIAGSAFAQASLGNVPAGKRYVIELISVSCVFFSAAELTDITLILNEERGNNTVVFHRYSMPFTRLPGDSVVVARFISLQPLRLYHDGNAVDLAASFSLAQSNPNGACTFEVSGYTVTAP
jgi:hypothetical protein